LRGNWIHFPLKPVDLLLGLPPSFGFGVSRDVLRKFAGGSSNGHVDTFASVLKRSLGPTICNDFYFPYARKIWGLPPEEIAATQAYRRVSAGSLGKIARKVLSLVPGFKTPGAGRFFYPRQGFGQISQSITDAAREHGADVRFKTTVRKVELGTPHRIEVECDGKQDSIEADHIWSTIPISLLARIISPAAPKEVLEASRRIDYRAMILVYLVLDQPQFTPFDAHYFPESDIGLTRLSEPKNYSGSTEPAGRTVLCGEIPCNVGDKIWEAGDDALADIVRDSLARCGLPIKSRVVQAEVKRLSHAYPIYRQGYEEAFALQDEWIAGLDRILTFGRQGLFAHDNTHHALAMAYAAVDCLKETGEFDLTRWEDYRAEFAKHVVED
jgi:protoporphyrinogen oxidase